MTHLAWWPFIVLAGAGQFAHHVQGPVIRRAFGGFLVAFGLFFTIDRIVAH